MLRIFIHERLKKEINKRKSIMEKKEDYLRD